MSKFLNNGSSWQVIRDENFRRISDELPVGTYAVAISQEGYFLSELEPFTTPEKVYGDASARADRVLETYKSRGRSTGVLAVGAKGTGKTMLARLISAKAAGLGISTLVVNTSFCGEAFNEFLASLPRPMVVFFDEFEKVYDKKQQTELLTLFDGVHQVGKLILLTANDAWEIDQNFISRPGRIYYHFEYGAIDPAFIADYCRDNLADTSKIQAILDVAGVYGNFNFDSLQALVEEMNRYSGSPMEALGWLNIKPDRFKQRNCYHIAVSKDGQSIDPDRVDDNEPLISPDTVFTIRISPDDDKDDEEDRPVWLKIRPSDIVAFNDGGRKLLYRVDGYEIAATIVETKTLDVSKFLASGYDH